ncbi:hypothetical protein quinque_004010 [Culex quinquefasciatus]
MPARPAMRRDHHRVNWVSLSRIVDSRIPDQLDLPTVEAIDNQLEALENAVHQAEARRLASERNIARRQFQRNGCLDKKEEVSLLNAEIRNRMLQIRNKQFANNISQKTDHSKPFWKVAKLLKKRPSPVPPLKVYGDLLVSPQEKVNAIAGKLVEAHHLGAGM